MSIFINKILSRIVHDRLESFVPKLISSNQSGIIKGWSIIENALLTQEIVTDIRKKGNPANVVIKIDMAKAYDRVYWFFPMKVLRKMSFSDFFLLILFGGWFQIICIELLLMENLMDSFILPEVWNKETHYPLFYSSYQLKSFLYPTLFWGYELC